MSIITIAIKYVLFIVIRIMEKIGQFIIHTVTIGTMLNFDSVNNGHGVQNVTCEQAVRVKRCRSWRDVGFNTGKHHLVFY